MSRWTALRTVRTAKITLLVEWTYDDDYVNDVEDENGEPDAETAAKLESGEWTAYGFRVRILANGVQVGFDSLWGSIYDSPQAAYANQLSGYLGDMVASAVRDARAALNDMPRVKAA